MLNNMFNIESKISYCLINSKCIYHRNRTSNCSYTLYETNKMLKLYGISYNVVVPEMIFFCSRRPCRKYSLLNHSSKIIEGEGDYISVNGQKVFKSGRQYILSELVLFINQHCLQTSFGKIGLIRDILYNNYITRARTILFNKQIMNYNEFKLKQSVYKEIPTYNRLCLIYDWLYMNNWYPQHSMYCKSIVFYL